MKSPAQPPRSSERPPALVAYAPAKLNLGLRILGRRPDGYHELESIFVGINLYDVLTLHPRADRQLPLRLSGASPDVTPGPDNLVVRAATVLQKHFGVSQGADLHLLKRIPSQAGLGGGSSDAAATLLALRTLWNVPATDAELHEIAAELGSDLNFFLTQQAAAIARGRGEQIEPLELPAPFHAVVAKPPFGASTGAVFSNLQLSTGKSADPTPELKFVQNVLLGRAQGVNDLLPALIATNQQFAAWFASIQERHRQKKHKPLPEQDLHNSNRDQHVSQGNTTTPCEPLRPRIDPAWSLTGSGTAVYRIVPSASVARRLALRLSSRTDGTFAAAVGPGRLRIRRQA